MGNPQPEATIEIGEVITHRPPAIPLRSPPSRPIAEIINSAKDAITSCSGSIAPFNRVNHTAK